MNREFLLTVLIVLTVALSVSTIYASEVNITDTYSSSSDDMYVSVYNSNVDNDSSNDNILKSDNSDSLSTYTESNSLSGSDDNANVLASSSENSLSASSTSKTITSSDLTKYYKGSPRYVATFYDKNGNLLKNTDVTVKLDGKTYTLKTNAYGKAGLTINLKPGSYKIVATNPVTGYSLSNTVNVLSTINSSDLTKYYKGSPRYIAAFYDSEGNLLKNTDVTVKLDGKTYTLKTNSYGNAGLTINLKPGTYEITATNPLNAETLTNNIKVLPTIVSKNLTKYYKGSQRYIATFYDKNGILLKNTDVTVNFDGKTYTLKTNTYGKAGLTINYKPGTYKITATNPLNAETLTNTIKVLPTVTSKDLTKYYKGSAQYSATFHHPDGDLLKNSDVELTINSKTYTVKTNANGVAGLTINLNPGTYQIVAKDPNTDYSITNNVKVLSTIINTKDISMVYSQDKYFYATFLKNDGKLLNNGNVKFNVNGATYTRTTDSKGVANLSLSSLPVGTHKIISYNADGLSLSNNIVVVKSASTTLKPYDFTFYTSENHYVRVYVVNGFDNAPVEGQNVTFGIDGKSYSATTNSKGVAYVKVPSLKEGNYDVTYTFAGNGIYAKSNASNTITIIPSKTPTFTVKSPTEIPYGVSTPFKVALTSGSVPLVGKTVTFIVNGVNYKKTTDANGIASLPINLLVGKYTITYTNEADSKIDSKKGSTTISVMQKSATKVTWKSGTSFNQGSQTYSVLLQDSKNNAIANKVVQLTVNSKTYSATTSSTGYATFDVNVPAGDYTVSFTYPATGDGVYTPSSGSVKIHVKKNDYAGYGYWLFGGDMKKVNLNTLASQGTTDIFLNYYAITVHGQSEVESWISSANKVGIRVHIWMQSFYDGSWINPIKNGTIDTAHFNQKIAEAKGYAAIKGISGIHLDYLRYPGTAYKTDGGSDAISTFTKQVSDAVRSVNSKIIVSCALMPETTKNEYYYGQDYSEISQYVDVVVPMIYKGNYGKTTSWISTTTKWFVDNSKGAKVWSGLQGYNSDDDVTNLAPDDIKSDVKAAIDANATGAVIFRWGVTNFVDFNTLNDTSPAPSDDGSVSVSDILTAAVSLKNTIASGKPIPTSVSVGGVTYSTAQFLYLMTSAVAQLNNGATSAKIAPVKASAPSNPSSTAKEGTLTLSQYLDVASRVTSFIKSNGQAPNYASSALGQIQYSSLVDAFSRVLAYYKTNNAMPNSVKINPDPSEALSSSESSSSSSSSSSSASSSSTTGKTISIKDIVTGSTNLKNYYSSNNQLPNTVTAGGVTFTLAEFVYLMSQAIHQVGESNSTNIEYMIGVSTASSPSGDAIDGNLEKDNYLTVANNVANFIRNYKQAPNYASSELGKINYNTLADAFSRVLAFYGANDMLPNYVTIKTAGSDSGSFTSTGSGLNEDNTISNLEAYLKSSTNCQVNASSIKSVVDSVTSGLSSDYDKANAIYNYVRDSISYSFYYDTKYGATGTLSAKTGNCVDQAHLLIAMYRTAGLAARYVHGAGCTFSSGTYGHVWTQVLVDGKWIVGDPTSSRNSFGKIVNWNTNSFTLKGIYSGISF